VIAGRTLAALAGLLLWLPLVAACDTNTAAHPDAAHPAAASDCGPSRCAQETWPRLIITLSPDRDFRGLQFRARYGDGVVRDATLGCPYGYASFVCSYSFYGDVFTKEFPVQALVDGQVVAELAVPLRPFNYCGVDVAHIIVEVGDSGMITFHEPQYVSPCKSL